MGLQKEVFLKLGLPHIGHLSKRIRNELDHSIVNYFPNVSLPLIFVITTTQKICVINQ